MPVLGITSAVPVDTFTVKQERGADSTVQVFQEVEPSWPIDRKILRFVSDQSLTSNSDRAWTVEKEIKEYARTRGFDISKAEKNEIKAVYNPSTHSSYCEYQVRQQIISDPRYQAKVGEAEQRRDAINREYGIAIRQLKNLVFALENRNRQELDVLKDELIATQLEVLQGVEIPEAINEQHRKFLFEPNYPIAKMEMDSFAEYGQRGKLPTNLDAILALLN